MAWARALFAGPIVNATWKLAASSSSPSSCGEESRFERAIEPAVSLSVVVVCVRLWMIDDGQSMATSAAAKTRRDE